LYAGAAPARRPRRRIGCASDASNGTQVVDLRGLSRRSPRRRGVVKSAPDDNPGIRFPPPFVYAALAGLAWWLHARWPLAAPERFGTALDRLGLGLMVAGLLLDAASLTLFLLERTSALPFRPASAFVARGPYRLTRNPMYLGMTMLVAGLGLLVERLGVTLAAFVAAAVIARFVIPLEERYLERRFGESYLDYKRRVRRWL
jgi:protein-S-isoprenylcysteine O-methyltransferase Ste14